MLTLWSGEPILSHRGQGLICTRRKTMKSTYTIIMMVDNTKVVDNAVVVHNTKVVDYPIAVCNTKAVRAQSTRLSPWWLTRTRLWPDRLSLINIPKTEWICSKIFYGLPRVCRVVCTAHVCRMISVPLQTRLQMCSWIFCSVGHFRGYPRWPFMFIAICNVTTSHPPFVATKSFSFILRPSASIS